MEVSSPVLLDLIQLPPDFRFHGKKPGKKQMEKHRSRVEKRDKMKKMNSSDTPLGTLERQRKKQEKLQTPYLMLSQPNKKR